MGKVSGRGVKHGTAECLHEVLAVAGLAIVQEVLAIRPKSGDTGYVAGLARVQEVLAIRPKSGDTGYVAGLARVQALSSHIPKSWRLRLRGLT